MTAILALTIVIILLIARYYGSPKLAFNLLLTLAISVMVGFGINYLTKDSKKNTSIEYAMSSPTQSLDQFATGSNSNLGIVSQETRSNKFYTQPTDTSRIVYVWSKDRITKEHIDSS